MVTKKPYHLPYRSPKSTNSKEKKKKHGWEENWKAPLNDAPQPIPNPDKVSVRGKKRPHEAVEKLQAYI